MTSISAHSPEQRHHAANNDDQFAAALLEGLPALKGFARRVAGSADLTEDFVQQALLKAWMARSSFASGTNIKAWIMTIIRNEIYSHFRQIKRRRRWHADWNDEFLQSVAAPDNGPLANLRLRDALTGLNTAVSAKQRAAILAVHVGNKTYNELAQLQNCPVGTAKSRVSRGIQKLRAWDSL